MRTILAGNDTGFIRFALQCGADQALDQGNAQDWAQGPAVRPLLQRWPPETGPEAELVAGSTERANVMRITTPWGSECRRLSASLIAPGTNPLFCTRIAAHQAVIMGEFLQQSAA